MSNFKELQSPDEKKCRTDNVVITFLKPVKCKVCTYITEEYHIGHETRDSYFYKECGHPDCYTMVQRLKHADPYEGEAEHTYNVKQRISGMRKFNRNMNCKRFAKMTRYELFTQNTKWGIVVPCTIGAMVLAFVFVVGAIFRGIQ